MRAAAFWKAVTVDEADLLGRFVTLLAEHHVAYCVVGGQGVNAYVDPMVSLDLDVVVAGDQLASVEELLRRHFDIKRFAHSVNVYADRSDLRIQLQTDPRYSPFVARAEARDVLGHRLLVARVEDVLQGKLWAFEDETRRGSKRQKDLADIARIVESYPHLRAMIPEGVLRRLV